MRSSRKGVVDTALNLVKVARLNQFIGSPAQQQQLNHASASIISKQLQQALPAGVGFHHAAMEAQDRATVEDLFRNRMLAVRPRQLAHTHHTSHSLQMAILRLQ